MEWRVGSECFFNMYSFFFSWLCVLIVLWTRMVIHLLESYIFLLIFCNPVDVLMESIAIMMEGMLKLLIHLRLLSHCVSYSATSI
jgi:hypothetical protein